MSDSSIQQFKSEQFGTIRTTTIDGEPWFVAKDVCEALSIKNVSDALSNLDEDEKGIALTDTLGGKQQMSVVSESGMYALVMRSRKPEARGFRKWVTNEVLPSIRKHGAYITPQTMADMMADPRNIAKVFNALADERQKVEALTEDNARMLPKAIAYDSFIDGDGTYSIQSAARFLSQIDIRMTVKRLYALLRADEFVCKQSRCPTKKAILRGYARQMMAKKANGEPADPYIHLTQKGLDWCVNNYVTVPNQMSVS